MGVKELSKNNKMFYYESNIEENEFRIEFKIDLGEKKLKSERLIKNNLKDGILKLYYEIEQEENIFPIMRV